MLVLGITLGVGGLIILLCRGYSVLLKRKANKNKELTLATQNIYKSFKQDKTLSEEEVHEKTKALLKIQSNNKIKSDEYEYHVLKAGLAEKNLI